VIRRNVGTKAATAVVAIAIGSERADVAAVRATARVASGWTRCTEAGSIDERSESAASVPVASAPKPTPATRAVNAIVMTQRIRI
jgi:hypothetical protein